ncbi:STAS domain-containing protein [Thermomonospora umbrina]|uniref:Anti-sigma factor antagonist n=1 Tax=Thermomonospora umbrina TaxID=111806 RepID=A0A3D9SUZ9_9ACTN|nr:STAS domain-containing protein [Thermomonospora umbrina]REE99789.1 anti-anti-sigma factor [Thermomonospora umbrina]
MTSMTLRKEIDFSVAVLRHRDRAVVYVSGDIDLNTKGHLRQALVSLIEERARQVIIDLREVGLFGSDALRVLAEAQLLADDRHVSLTLAAVPQGVLRILEITGMADTFTIRRLAAAPR